MVSLKAAAGALLLALCTTTQALNIGITRYNDVKCNQAIGDGRYGQLKDDGRCLTWDDELPFVAISFQFKYPWQMVGDSRFCTLQGFEGPDCTGRFVGHADGVNRRRRAHKCAGDFTGWDGKSGGSMKSVRMLCEKESKAEQAQYLHQGRPPHHAGIDGVPSEE